MVAFRDKIPLRWNRRTQDANGFVQVPAILTKAGVQFYSYQDIGFSPPSGKKPTDLVGVLRPKETVSDADTIKSFAHLPVTDGHPPEGVTPDKARGLVGGHVGEDTQIIDEEKLGATLYIYDQELIDKSKEMEISAGYDASVVPEKGEFNGQSYEFKFDGAMIGNHIALVPKGRCGPECKVLDNKTGEETMDEKEVKKLVSDAVGASTDELKKTISETVATAVKTQMDEMKKLADEEAKKKADEEAKKLADQKAVESRVETLVKLKPLLGDKFDAEKSTKDLLVLALGDSIDDAESKSEDYLLAMVDAEIERRGKAFKKDETSDSYSDENEAVFLKVI